MIHRGTWFCMNLTHFTPWPDFLPNPPLLFQGLIRLLNQLLLIYTTFLFSFPRRQLHFPAIRPLAPILSVWKLNSFFFVFSSLLLARKINFCLQKKIHTLDVVWHELCQKGNWRHQLDFQGCHQILPVISWGYKRGKNLTELTNCSSAGINSQKQRHHTNYLSQIVIFNFLGLCFQTKRKTKKPRLKDSVQSRNIFISGIQSFIIKFLGHKSSERI